jgi:hypothetical protein
MAVGLAPQRHAAWLSLCSISLVLAALPLCMLLGQSGGRAATMAAAAPVAEAAAGGRSDAGSQECELHPAIRQRIFYGGCLGISSLSHQPVPLGGEGGGMSRSPLSLHTAAQLAAAPRSDCSRTGTPLGESGPALHALRQGREVGLG